MTLLEEILGAPLVAAPRPVASGSADLRRIMALDKRERPDLGPIQVALTAELRRDNPACRCRAEYHRPCADSLRPIQTWALHEIRKYGGLLGPIGVGEGKTLLDILAAMVMPDCKVAVLFLPASLRNQLLDVDWGFYGQHWKLPNLVGTKWVDPKRPFVHVMSFDELSREKATDLLERIKPDTVVVDEGHKIAAKKSVRTRRFINYFRAHPKTRLCVWSGTLTRRSIRDYAHLSAMALRDRSPLPLEYATLETWAEILDPNNLAVDEGELRRLKTSPDQTALVAFQKRMTSTPGVVASPDTVSCPAALYIHERPVKAPQRILDASKGVAATWCRPDGEELVLALDVARCRRELVSGFFYFWHYPQAEPLEVRRAWLSARKEWHKELREKLKNPRPHMDSPLLCTRAAIRATEGYSGPLPAWGARYWPEWRDRRLTVQPVTKAEWVDDYLVRDAAAWLAEAPGVVWYEHDAFGRALAKLSGAPLFGPGEDAAIGILKEDGTRSIVASIRAHGTGRNLQMFNRALVANPPADGATWEQLLGRHHRPGQEADEVNFYVYRHADVYAEAIDTARDLAQYIEDSFGGSQRLRRATFTW
jgi:hypothetical protein